jgi:hypothetical protein
VATIASLAVKLGLNSRKFDSGIKRSQAGLDSMIERLNKFDAVGKAVSMVGIVQQVLSLASAIAPASGALLAGVAVLGVFAAAAMATKVATAGVGDAMAAVAEGDAEKLNESLKKLSPNARLFVKSWAGIREQFKPIQRAVQDKFFEGLGKDLGGLTERTLPAAAVGLKATASSLNGLMREGIQTAGSPLFSGQLEKAGTGAADVIARFKGSIGGLLTGLLAVINVGMPFVDQLAKMASGGLASAGAFLSSEAGAERMRATLQRGFDTVRQLITIFGNFGSIVSGVLRAAGVDGDGMLVTISRITSQISVWVNSTAGQTAIHDWFTRMAEVAGQVAQVIPHLVTAAGWLFDVLNQLPGPVKELALQGLAWALVLSPIATKLLAVGSAAIGLLRGVAAIGTFTASVLKIVTASTAAQAATAKASAGIVARMTAAAISGTVAAAKTVAGWVTMGASAIAGAAKVVAGWAVAAGAAIAQGAAMAGSMALTAARVVAGWALMGGQALIHAAKLAAAWVIGMGPVGWVIAAVVGIVALIIANWDTIVAATKAAWEWVGNAVSSAIDWVVDFVKNNWKLLITIILGPLGAIIALVATHWDKIVAFFRAGVDKALAIFAWFGELPGRIGGWFRQMHDAAVSKVLELVGWLGGLAGRVLGALGDVGSWLVQTGRNLIEGLIRGVQQVAGRIADAVLGPIKDSVDKVKNFLGIASPSKLAAWLGRMTGKGFANGLTGMVSVVGNAADRLAVAAVPAVPVPRLSGMAAATGSSGSGDSGRGRALVQIENYHPPADASADEVAHDLDWFSRGGG